MRFSELQRQFSDTTRKMLTRELRELETDGLVHREVSPGCPALPAAEKLTLYDLISSSRKFW